MSGQRILAEHCPRLRRQTVDASGHIDRTAGEEHLRPRRQADHAAPFIARSTRASACTLTKASTLTRLPFGSAMSMAPDLASLAAAAGMRAASGDRSIALPALSAW